MPSDKIKIAVKREERVKDGGGGKTITETTTYSELLATRRYKDFKRKFRRLEEGQHATAGPGISTSTEPFYVLRAIDYPNGYPDIRINDWIIDPNGGRWRVFLPRVYLRTLQIDVERVQ